MKMLFFSSDRAEVDLVRKELVQEGIPCEVRCAEVAPTADCRSGLSGHPADAELWVLKDQDAYTAFLLCVRLGIGFAKREAHKLAA